MNGTNCLKTDLYEMTMAAGYFQNKHNPEAVFELYCHTLPEDRAYLVVCGLQQIIDYILTFRFSAEDIRYLKSLPAFAGVSPGFFRYLQDLKFTGDLWALPEGSLCFANEPLVQVKAPLIQAQILETYLLSIINIETLVATKASRIVQAAGHDGRPRPVIDFGSRRAHGPEAGVLAARAAFIGGCMGTSNVYAARAFKIPVFGTMAHSWVQSYASEETAFKNFQSVFPKHTTLLVDTYDTIKGVKNAIRLKKDIRGVRLDSGDIKALSFRVRKLLDQSGLKAVKILASGNLNEYKIADLVRSQAPIDIFGVGTDMVVSRDQPVLDLTYKLVQTEGKAGKIGYHFKTSQGKATVPARKQVFRYYDVKGKMRQDVIGLFAERCSRQAVALLKPFINRGKLMQSLPAAEEIRKTTAEALSRLPAGSRMLKSARSYRVSYSRSIQKIKNQCENKRIV